MVPGKVVPWNCPGNVVPGNVVALKRPGKVEPGKVEPGNVVILESDDSSESACHGAGLNRCWLQPKLKTRVRSSGAANKKLNVDQRPALKFNDLIDCNTPVFRFSNFRPTLPISFLRFSFLFYPIESTASDLILDMIRSRVISYHKKSV